LQGPRKKNTLTMQGRNLWLDEENRKKTKGKNEYTSVPGAQNGKWADFQWVIKGGEKQKFLCWGPTRGGLGGKANKSKTATPRKW